MMISTRGRYALRVLVDMAENQKDGYIPLKDIAARQEISEKYLESIVKILVKEKIVTAVRGNATVSSVPLSPLSVFLVGPWPLCCPKASCNGVFSATLMISCFSDTKGFGA